MHRSRVCESDLKDHFLDVSGLTRGMRGSYHASSDESFPSLVPQNFDFSMKLGLNITVQISLQLLCRKKKTAAAVDQTSVPHP